VLLKSVDELEGKRQKITDVSEVGVSPVESYQ